jgi:iron complex outermembrane receptor protein
VGGDDDEPGVIEVEPGDRMPGVPTHSVKAGIAVRPVPRWELALSTVAQSGQYHRGDEANLMDALDGYAVLNARTSYDLFDQLQLVVKFQNLLNSEYQTFGVVADPSEVLPQYSDPRFQSPGPPFGVWAGIVVHDG